MIFPQDVPGWLTTHEGTTLARLAKGKVVLEIGSFKGRSTICMAQTAKVVHAVDWHRGDRSVGTEWTAPAFFENLERYCIENVVAHVGRTEQLAHVLGDDVFDMAFIDGDHDYESVKRDAMIAARVVKPDGIIAAHDVGYQSVKTALIEVLGWENDAQLIGSLRYERNTKTVSYAGYPAA